MAINKTNSKTFSIVDLGNELDAVVLEQSILDRFKNVEGASVDWSDAKLTVWFTGNFPEVEEVNAILRDLGVTLTSVADAGPNGIVSLRSTGFLKIHRRNFKIWLSAVGFALGSIILISAFSDYQATTSSIQWGFLNIFRLPEKETLLGVIGLISCGLIFGIFRFYLGVEKLLYFDHLSDEGKKKNVYPHLFKVVLNSLGRFMVLSIAAMVIVFLGEYVNDYVTAFFMFTLLLASGLTVSGAWRSRNPIARYNYVLGSIIRDLRIKNTILSELVKGVLTAKKIGPISLMILSAILLSASYSTAFITVAFIEFGALVMTLILNYLSLKYRYEIGLSSTYWYKVYGMLFVMIAAVLLNDYYTFMSLPNLSEIGTLTELWRFIAVNTVLIMLVKLLFDNVWRLMFKPVSFYRSMGLFLIMLYGGIIIEILWLGKLL